MYDRLHIPVLNAENVNVIARILSDNLPVGENKTVGDDERAVFAFLFDFCGEALHFPRYEIDENYVRIVNISVPKIFPACMCAS